MDLTLKPLLDRIKAVRPNAAAAAAGLLLAALPAVCAAQAAPKYLITTPTTLPTPSGFGGPIGNLATDQFGNLFVPDAAQSQVLEYPANGGAATVIFDATKTGPQVSGVAVDAQNNLYVTTRYDGAVSATETDIFKFPYSSSGYPAAYTYGGASPSTCSAMSTGVCNYGNFLQVTGYYYQPQAIGFDGAGNGYMITTYDSLSGGGKTIFACDVACGYNTDSGTIAVNNLPTTATSLAVASNGDLYWADGSDVYISRAGSGTFAIFDKSYESSFGGAAGVAFDRAGNLLVTNSGGTYEVPAVGGVITAANKFQVAVSTVGGYAGAAVDASGNVYSAAYSTLLKSSLYNYSFGSIALGSTVAPQTFTITFLSAGTINSLTVLQGSKPATEFVLAPGTCTPAGHAVGDQCTFTVGFTPTAVGTRRATAVMTDSSGVQTYVYLVGVGLGTGVTVDPGTPTAIATTLKAPSGMAVDGAGNLFVADAGAKAVYEYLAGAGTPVTIGAGFTKPTGVAVDGAGNLYVVDQGTGIVSFFVSNNGSYLTAGTGAVLASGLKSPTDVVVSGTGSIYVSNTGANLVQQYPNASRLSSLASVLSLGINLSGPTGLSLDPSGNLYIADTGNNRVVQLGFSGAQVAFGSGLLAPTGVSAEPSGSVLIADQGNGRIVRVPNENGVLTTADQVALSQPLVNPFSIRLTSSGNLYVSDNVVGAIDSLQRTAGTLNFGFSNVNTSSAAQSVVISNTGTANLALTSPFFTAPPAGSSFTLQTGSGSSGCTSGTLTTGFDCLLTSVFTPSSIGAKMFTVPFNTMAANTTGPSIMLVGQGVQLVAVNVALTKTSPTGTVSYGVPVVLSASVSSASAGSTAVPAGNIIFNVDGQNSKPVALNATGTASLTLNGLAGGSSHTVIATFTGSSVYASGNSTAYVFTVTPATTQGVLTVNAEDTAPLSNKPSGAAGATAVGFSVNITPSIVVSGGLTGSVNFVSGNTVLGSGTITQNSTTGIYSAYFSTTALTASCLTGQTLPACSNIYQVQAVFAGNGNYSGFSTAAQALIITNPTFSVVSSSNTITSTAAQYGTSTLTVTSYDNFQAGVSLTCSGLPANAYCIFRPGLISLTYVPVSAAPGALSTIPVQTTTMEIRVSQNPVDIQSASSFGVIGLITGFVLFLLGLSGSARSRVRSWRGLATCCLICVVSAMMLGAFSGCSSSNSGSSYPTPAGTYNIMLNEVATPLSGTQAPTAANITSIQLCSVVAAQKLANAVTCTQPGSYIITTQVSSGLSAGQTATVAATTPAIFSGNFTVLSDVGESTIVNNVPIGYYDEVEIAAPAGAPASGTGGSIRLANFVQSQPFTLVVK